MIAFWIVGIAGAALFVVSLVVGDLLHGVIDSIDVTDGYISTAAVAGFAGAFGLAGGVATASGASTLAGILVGLLVGAAVAVFAGWLTRALRNGETDKTPTSADFVDLEGTVITSVPKDGYGEVSLRVGGQRLKLNARGDLAIAAGTRIRVLEALSPTSVRVAPATPQDAR